MEPMAIVDEISRAAAPPTHLGDDASPPLFRFGLRRMFLFVSGLAALGGVMAMVRGGWAVGIGFGAAMAAAHVLATSIGTRLRDRTSRANLRRAAKQGAAHAPMRRLTREELAALTATPLARHGHAPFRTLLSAAGGATAGGFFGAAAAPILAGPSTTGAELALGAASCAVMGAWMALLAAHFWSVMRRTWRDANGGDQTGASQPRRKRMFRRV